MVMMKNQKQKKNGVRHQFFIITLVQDTHCTAFTFTHVFEHIRPYTLKWRTNTQNTKHTSNIDNELYDFLVFFVCNSQFKAFYISCWIVSFVTIWTWFILNACGSYRNDLHLYRRWEKTSLFFSLPLYSPSLIEEFGPKIK